MQGDITVCKALCAPGVVKGIMLCYAAVYGDKNVLALGRTNEAHMLRKPALQPAALVIIFPAAFLGIIVAALEAVNVKFTHIRAHALKILYKLAVA